LGILVYGGFGFRERLFRAMKASFRSHPRLMLSYPPIADFSVDPMLGVSRDGNVFPGPLVPFGMIKPGPDMVPSV
jgi:putative alpha-1,2-mannosidase